MSPFDRIHEILVRDGLSQQEMAEVLGVSNASVSHFVSGRNQPKLEAIKSFLIHYPSVDIRWILFGEKPEGNSGALEDQPKGKTISQVILIFQDGTFQSLDPMEG